MGKHTCTGLSNAVDGLKMIPGRKSPAVQFLRAKQEDSQLVVFFGTKKEKRNVKTGLRDMSELQVIT